MPAIGSNPYSYHRPLVNIPALPLAMPAVPCGEPGCRGVRLAVGGPVPVNRGQMIRATFRCTTCGALSTTVQG